MKANIQYLVDKYSTAAKDSSVNARLTIRVRDDLYGRTASKSYSLSSLSGSKVISVVPANAGINSVSISLSDGKYSDSLSLGYVHVPVHRLHHLTAQGANHYNLAGIIKYLSILKTSH